MQNRTLGHRNIQSLWVMSPPPPDSPCPECQSLGGTLNALKSSADEDFNYFHCDACSHEWIATKATDARTRAEELVASLTSPLHEPCVTGGASAADRAELTDAIERDLTAADDDVAAAEQRLQKLESQTRGLAEAVIAITEPSMPVAQTVKIVKDGM